MSNNLEGNWIRLYQASPQAWQTSTASSGAGDGPGCGIGSEVTDTTLPRHDSHPLKTMKPEPATWPMQATLASRSGKQ